MGGLRGGEAVVVRAAGAGFAAGCGEVTGMASPSGWSPRTVSVLIFRGSLFGIVPFALVAGGAALGATLAADGGLPFGFSGGKPTRVRTWH